MSGYFVYKEYRYYFLIYSIPTYQDILSSDRQNRSIVRFGSSDRVIQNTRSYD